MPLVNWPPATAPAWPPPGYTLLEFTGILEGQQWVDEHGWTRRNPTNAERTAFFNSARCQQGHTVTGRMFVNPANNVAYPFALCTGVEQEALVLWPPYTAGAQA